MNLLALECGNKGIANLLYIIKQILQIIQIIGPILAIGGMVIISIKMMSNPDDKLKKSFFNCLIALVMLFVIPILVNVVMNYLDESFTLAACWTQAESARSSGDSDYIKVNEGEESHGIVDDPSGYEEGEEKVVTGQGAGSFNKLIFIGDSRTVGMKISVNTDDIWSCEGSMGLDWMKSTGVPQIESSIGPKTAIIILMGVNDLWEPEKYLEYINGKVDGWYSKGAATYFVAVMPTRDRYQSLNTEIDSFNSVMKSGLSSKVRYIDANSYIDSTGFNSHDGLHYDVATYKRIYEFIKSNL